MPKKSNSPEYPAPYISAYDYRLFYDFVDFYLPTGFVGINDDHGVMQKLNPLMEQNDQMLIVMNLTDVKIIFTSRQSSKMLGIDPASNTLSTMLDHVHPDDLDRFGMGRAKLLNMDKDLLLAQKGSVLLSTTIEMRKPNGQYANHLFQCYLFYSDQPRPAVYYVQVNTNVDWFKMKKDCFHYYVGSDISLFRFPDEELLRLGHNLTPREFEILKLISSGLNSDEIAKKLNLSTHTVNTHRSNVLQKYPEAHISDVVFKLMAQGLI